MNAVLVAMGAGAPALMLAMGVAIAGSASKPAGEEAYIHMAAVTETPAIEVPVALTPLNQVSNAPERVATARVTDMHGKVVGAVQRVEIQNGLPVQVDIALLGSANLIRLDAATLRYDAATNIVATGQSMAQLMARTQT